MHGEIYIEKQYLTIKLKIIYFIRVTKNNFMLIGNFNHTKTVDKYMYH